MVSLECARQAIDMAKREAIHQLEETTNNALNEMERVGTDALHKLNEIRRNNPKCSECPAEAVEISDEAISILDSILQVTIVSLNVICGYTCKESRHIFDLGLKYMGPASEVIERCFDDLAKLLQKYIKELTKALDKFEHAVKKDLYHSGKYAKKKSNQFKKFVKAVKKKSSHIFRKSSSNLNTKSSHTMDASSVHLDQVLISALKSSHILSDKSTKEVVNRTSSVVNITTPDDSDKK